MQGPRRGSEPAPLVANLVIFHNCHTITLASKDLEAQGWALKDLEPDPVDYSIRFSTGAG